MEQSWFGIRIIATMVGLGSGCGGGFDRTSRTPLARGMRRKQFASGGHNAGAFAGAKRRPKIFGCAPSLFSCAPT